MRWSIKELIYGIQVASNRECKIWYRIIHCFSSGWRIIKVIFKWIFTGYCWATVWGLDYYLIDVYINRLKQFRKMHKRGHPANLTNDEEWWYKIIDRLIHGFEIMKSKEYGLDYDMKLDQIVWKDSEVMGVKVKSFNVERTPEEEAKMKAAWKKQADYDKETMELFNEYFRNLWD